MLITVPEGRFFAASIAICLVRNDRAFLKRLLQPWYKLVVEFSCKVVVSCGIITGQYLPLILE